MTWAKIKFFYDNLLGQTGTTLTATSIASGYDVNNLYSMFEVNKWMAANTTDPHYITLDTASAPRTTADYLIIHGHNLGTVSATAVLQYSDNASTWYNCFDPVMLRSDNTFLKEFTIPAIYNGSFEYWANGPSSLPDGWSISGSYTSVTQDASNTKAGRYAIAMTGSAGGANWLTQQIPNYAYYLNRIVSFGAWIKTSTPSFVGLQIEDGISTTSGSNHTGSGNWEFLTVTRTISSTATKVEVDVRQGNQAAVAYYDGAVFKVASSVSSTDTNDLLDPLSASKRYWRLKLTGHTAAPYITILQWGLKTELNYASASYDPTGQEIKANVNQSYGGYVTGIHTQYNERSMTLTFEDVQCFSILSYLADGTYTAGGSITASGGETTLWNKIQDGWDKVGMGQFFVAWENNNRPDDIFLMRSDGKFSNPLQRGGGYRNVTINLKGVKK